MQLILNKLNEILAYVRNTNPSKYIDISEVSELSGVSKSTIRRNVQKGSLKCSNATGKTLFKVEEVERWLNN
jgi:excisionase family DNA binding protein